MFCISFFHVSLQQARIITSDNENMIKNYQIKTTTNLTDSKFLTDCYSLTCINSCMLFPHFSFLSAQQRSVCCLINEYDDDDDDDDDDGSSEGRGWATAPFCSLMKNAYYSWSLLLYLQHFVTHYDMTLYRCHQTRFFGSNYDINRFGPR